MAEPTIVDSFSSMSNEVRQIEHPSSETWIYKPKIKRNHHEFWKLVAKCWGRDLAQPCYNPPAMKHLLGFRPLTVIQALTTSAILVWVLENDSKVSEGAKELAVRLIDALSPLFEYFTDDWRGTDAPRHIENAFKYALKIKADLRLETETYEVLLYRPGTRFNEETMLLESRVQGRFVSLCVQPALLRLDDPLSDRRHTALKAVVVLREA